MNEEKTEKSEVAKREEEILAFWQANKIFEKSVEKESPQGEFVFYEGPPTANAKPALHHLEARVFKDIIPRYKTMQGFHVRRKGGWDTHGLPVELQIEKKLGLTSKKDIEKYGVEAFNKACKESVFEYIGDWEKFTDRIGYWVDKEDAYYTFNPSYMESVWNILKTVDDKKLLYKDYKVLPWCPRCGTALSSHELAQGYQEDKDLSVTVKFKVTNPEKIGLSGDVFLLAWTTTPWTLPGNVALAVGPNLEYLCIEVSLLGTSNITEEQGGEVKQSTTIAPGKYVIAKSLWRQFRELMILSKNGKAYSDYCEGKIKEKEFFDQIETLKGKELVGLSYEPLYPYMQEKFREKDTAAFEKAYQVYVADFVNTTEGTGIVHTAVMYGQDDFVLGTQIGLPKFHLVNEEGKFIEGTEFLSGRFVKEMDEKGKPTLAVDIIDDLKKKGFFFSQENIKHQYPHCWRCKTPLIYYARDSWYIRMSSLREELVKENEGINWEPKHIKEGRFGEWLREVKDWAISRERYWGTPLPIWKKATARTNADSTQTVADGNGDEYIVIGSIDELKKHTKKSGNTYFAMRHGQAENNTLAISSVKKDNPHHLTEKGKSQVQETIQNLGDKKITKIIASPFVRTRETAEMVAEALGILRDDIIFDERLSEHNVGAFNNEPIQKYRDFCAQSADYYTARPPEGETIGDMKNRAGEFLYELERTYVGETILIVTHEDIVWMLTAVTEGQNKKGTLALDPPGKEFIKNADVQKIDFVPLPHDENYELDLHKPFIDSVELVDEDGTPLTRVKEVMDVWFDSGGMPFAQDADSRGLDADSRRQKTFEEFYKHISYPADFISEAIDQTRGWFYTLHAIGILMGKGKAYKNVICLGHILDAEGKKMSKSIGNIVDPWIMMNTYGVDALRLWMFSVNQPGDSKNFDEETVHEIVKKVFNPLNNIVALYELYADKNLEPKTSHLESSHVLDRWIVSRLNELVKEGTKSLDEYHVFEASRAIRDFVNDFSTWYIRRSRERFKSDNLDDKNNALDTTRFVLIELMKYMAPFTPFFAEELYRKLRTEEEPMSIHLCDWPKEGEVEKNLIDEMQKVREVVTFVLEARSKAGIKVRQPLASLVIKENLTLELRTILAEEVNVKEVVSDETLETPFELDITITPELQIEGNVRDLIRAIQDARKTANLTPSQVITLSVETDESGKKFIETNADAIKKPTNVGDFVFEGNGGEEFEIENRKYKIKIK